jgi:penicillin G amidase
MRVIFCLFCILPFLIAPIVEAKPPTNVVGLKKITRVMRDVDGIPHIIAKNEHDMVLMQGWVHAQDRLFQMDFTRRQASGTLAELLGTAVLAGDVEFRTLGLRRAAERSLDAASNEMKAALEAYAKGVNAYVATHQLPPEYESLELSTFEPWTAIDSLVIGKLFALSNLFGLDLELTEALLSYQAAGDALPSLPFDGTALFFEDLFRSAPFDPASTVPDATAALPLGALTATGKAKKEKAAKKAALQPETFKLIKSYLDRVRQLPILQRAIKLGEQSGGSNEFAVSGDHTASGQPILANDPHLDLNAPSVFYQIHLKAKQAGFDVIGSGFAGVPFITIGQNEHIAWGATSNPMDVTDFFQEQIVPDASSPSGLSTIYLGSMEPIIPVPQVFRYNKIGDGVPDNLITLPEEAAPPPVLIVPRRNQGPIIQLNLVEGTALSVQSTGFSGTQELDAFRSFNLARNLDDFTLALQSFDFGPGNFAYVDVKGNIAYFMSGEMPIREDLQAGFVNGLPPFFIRNGTGGNEWLPVETPQPGQATPFEILPFDEMPQVINPSVGYFVNANNDPAGHTLDNNALNQLRPGGGIFYLNPSFDFGTRAGRITQALKERIAAAPVTPDDMKGIQADTVMLDAQVFTPFILEAYANAMASADPLLAALAADPRVAEVAANGGRLDSWDYSTPTGVEAGYDASDIDGQLLPPTEEEIQASVAATIYAVWRGQIIKNTIDAVLDPLGLPRPGSRETMKALRNLLDNFDTNQGIGASGLNFFNVPDVDDAATRRDILILKSLVDALDRLAGPEFAEAFGGSADQDDYRWGRLHRLVLNHPLGGPFSIPPAGGAFPSSFPDLAGISVDGGFGVVDAASHSARADSSNDFMFDNGPVRRYVGQPSRAPRGFEAETSLSGGASGILGDPFFDNLLDRWLTNDTYKVRHRIPDVLRDKGQKEVFKPAR